MTISPRKRQVQCEEYIPGNPECQHFLWIDLHVLSKHDGCDQMAGRDLGGKVSRSPIRQSSLADLIMSAACFSCQ